LSEAKFALLGKEKKMPPSESSLGVYFGGASRMTAVAANLDFFGPRLFTELAAILLVGLARTGNVGTFFHIGHTVSSKARDRSARSISCRKSNLGRLGKILYARAEIWVHCRRTGRLPGSTV